MNQRAACEDSSNRPASTASSLGEEKDWFSIDSEGRQFSGNTTRQHGRTLLHIALCMLASFPRAYALAPQKRSLQEGATGSSVDNESCYASLNVSDSKPSDGILSQSEFLFFVQSSANGTLDTNQYGMPITEFYLLPPELISIYNVFACGSANYGCPSVPGIDISGISNEGGMPTAQQGIFLFQLCTSTEQTINDVTESVPETTKPTPSLSLSVAPTASSNSTTPFPTLYQSSSRIPTLSPTTTPPSPSIVTIAPSAPSNSTTPLPTSNGTNLAPTITSPTASPVAQSSSPTTTPISTTSQPTLNATKQTSTISPTTSPVPQSLVPTTTIPTMKATTGAPTTSQPTLNATKQTPTISPTTSPVPQSLVPTTTIPTMKATTEAPILSPTTPFPTPIPRCPPIYKVGESYEAGDEVANDGEEGRFSYYRCKPYPMSGWCSQSAYEPGNSLNWEESWTLLGKCLEDEPGTSVPSSVVIATSTAPTLAPIKIPTASPSFKPTALDGNDPPYSGQLVTTFHYEIYNSENCNAQSILTGENPTNNIMSVLTQSTEEFLVNVVTTTFGSDDDEVNHSKTGRRRRRLSVILEPSAVAIASVDDVPCPGATFTSPCQNVTASVALTLVDEPVLSTNEEFQTATEQALIDPGLSFPMSSGVFYYMDPSSTSSGDVIPPLELPDSNAPTTSPVEKQDGTPSWVVPVSICIAVIASTLLLLLVGKEVRKRKRNGIEYGGSARKEPNDEDVYKDIMGASNREGSSGSFPEILISPDKDVSPLDADNLDIETGKRSGNVQSKNNPFLEGSDSSSNSRNSYSSEMSSEFTSSSSSDSLIATNYPDTKEVSAKNEQGDLTQTQPEQAQPMLHFMSLNTLNEEVDLSSSEQSLMSSNNSDGKFQDKVAYRAGVEALVKEACPEKLDRVDDLLAEYDGREELLIDNLTRILADKRQAQPMLHFMSLNTLQEEGTLSSSEQSLMSSSNSIGKLVDKVAYRAGVVALVEEACPDKIDQVDDLLVEYNGREELLIDHLTRMLADKRHSQDNPDRSSTATFDDVSENTQQRATTTFDYDYSSVPRQPPTSARGGRGTDTALSPAIMEGGNDDDSESASSSVGSSEWSSDDGFSSIDATSLTASEPDGPDTAAALAAIDEASALNSQVTSHHIVPNPMFLPVDTNPDSHSEATDHATRANHGNNDATQDDLDKAIEAGDWRAVSATAALIANAHPTESKAIDESDHSQLSKSAQNQVEEFEQLVEDGNWDAVIAAATRIESTMSDVESLNESWLSADESVPNFEGRWQVTEGYADLANKSQEELIAEIQVLVADVVPDELENLDEMLHQFSGREADLVTTLRTMQNYRDESANAGVFEEDRSVSTND